MNISDQIRWARARAGDADAFGALFERHVQDVYRFCFWRTADAALAEDLTSAVFLETWRHKGGTELSASSLLPWLLGVAANLLRNHRRSLRRREAALRRLPTLAAEPDFADDTSARLDAEAAMRAVLAVVNDLPERDREVLMLCGWADLSYAEAAGALGIPIGTVRSRLAKARKRLTARLNEQHSEARNSHQDAQGSAAGYGRGGL
jgi:RNA polymerase sigma factor (sigma-70 family)